MQRLTLVPGLPVVQKYQRIWPGSLYRAAGITDLISKFQAQCPAAEWDEWSTYATLDTHLNEGLQVQWLAQRQAMQAMVLALGLVRGTLRVAGTEQRANSARCHHKCWSLVAETLVR